MRSRVMARCRSPAADSTSPRRCANICRQDYPHAVDVLLASASQPHEHRASGGMAAFLYMPHLFFVAQHGLDHFEDSMRAQHALTQRFTAEYSIRAFLEKHPERTLARLREWTRDPSPHVRRLVSEGTRPRLPWAPRLRAFQKDPRPVLELLELLKDDPELYVRRSVANNLNDIGKDHPGAAHRRGEALAARRDRRAALDRESRAAFGGETRRRGRAGRAGLSAARPRWRCATRRIAPPRAKIGGSVTLSFTLVNKQPQAAARHGRPGGALREGARHGRQDLQAQGAGSGAARARVTLTQEDRAAAAHYAQALSGCAQGRSAAQWPARELGQFTLRADERSAPARDSTLASACWRASSSASCGERIGPGCRAGAGGRCATGSPPVLEHVVIEHLLPDRALAPAAASAPT